MSPITSPPAAHDRLSRACRRSRRRASELLDDELALPARLGLQAHLTTCSECRHFCRELQLLTTRLRGHQLPSTPLLGLERHGRRRIIAHTTVALAAAAVVTAAVLEARPTHRTNLLPRTEGIFLRVESNISYDHTTHMS
jgi:hypothetical protein